MGRVRTKPVETDALQWTGDNLEEMREFCGSRLGTDEAFPMPVFTPIGTYLPVYLNPNMTAELWMESIHSRMPIETGTWVVREGLGFKNISEEEFTNQYEPVN